MGSIQHTLSALLLLGAIAPLTPCAAAAPAAAEDGPAVAVVVALPAGEPVDTAVIEFYRAVIDAIGLARTWNVVPTAAVLRALPRPTALASLGSLPAFDRRILEDQYPDLALYRPTPSGAKAKPNHAPRIIKPVQALLETLALPGALIVDCKGVGTTQVRGCGVYYYSRAEGRISASAQRQFLVPIADATRWAPALIASLKDGIRNAAALKDQHLIEAMVAKSDDDEQRHLRFAFGADAGGASVHCTGCGITSLPFAGIYAGAEENGLGFGLEVALGRSSTSVDGKTQSLERTHVAAVVGVSSHALEAMIWNLEIATGFYQATFRGGPGAQVDLSGSLVSLRPGLGFQLSKAVTVGFGPRLERTFVSRRQSQGQGDAVSPGPDAIGLALQIRGFL